MGEFIDYSELRHQHQGWVDSQVKDLQRIGVRGITTQLEPEPKVSGYLGLDPVKVTLIEDGRCRVEYGEPGPVRRWWRKRKKARRERLG